MSLIYVYSVVVLHYKNHLDFQEFSFSCECPNVPLDTGTLQTGLRLTPLSLFHTHHPAYSWGLIHLALKVLFNKNVSHEWKSLGTWKMEIPSLKPYSTVFNGRNTTLKSNRVERRKWSWAVIPAVALTNGTAREASLHSQAGVCSLVGQAGIQAQITSCS